MPATADERSPPSKATTSTRRARPASMRGRARALQAAVADSDPLGAAISDRACQPAQHSGRRRDEAGPKRAKMIDMGIEAGQVAFCERASGLEALAGEPLGPFRRQYLPLPPVLFYQLQVSEVGVRPCPPIAPRRGLRMSTVEEQRLWRRHPNEPASGHRQPQQQVDVFDQSEPLVEPADAVEPGTLEQLAPGGDEVVVFELIGERVGTNARITQPVGRFIPLTLAEQLRPRRIDHGDVIS